MSQFRTGFGHVRRLSQIEVNVFSTAFADQWHFRVAVVVWVVLTNADQLAVVSVEWKGKKEEQEY